MEDVTVPLNKKLLNLSCSVVPAGTVKALSSSLIVAGIWLFTSLNRKGLLEVSTCASEEENIITERHSTNNLVSVFM